MHQTNADYASVCWARPRIWSQHTLPFVPLVIMVAWQCVALGVMCASVRDSVWQCWKFDMAICAMQRYVGEIMRGCGQCMQACVTQCVQYVGICDSAWKCVT